MKFVLLLVASSFVSAQALACEGEAQFIGAVKNHVRVIGLDESVTCFYEIDFTLFNESNVCPLSAGEVSGQKFVDKNCSLVDSATVLGILVRSGNSIEIE